MLLAVKTKPITPNWLFNKKIAIIILSSFPIIFPAFNSSKFSFGEVLGEIEVNNFLINREAGSNIIEKTEI